MLILGPIGFTAPALLWALAVLPAIWFLLRVVPPAPLRQRFPGVALLLGLADRDSETDRTPWWLLLLRLTALAAVILGLAGPIWKPAPPVATSGPLLVVADASWASAPDWARTMTRVRDILDEAGRAGRTVAVVSLADTVVGRDQAPVFTAADAARQRLPSILPRPWQPDQGQAGALAGALPEGRFDTLWLSDGVERDGREALLSALQTHGTVGVLESPRAVLGLTPLTYRDGAVGVTALRARTGAEAEVEVVALGPDPNGVERELARATAAFGADDNAAEVRFDLPAELRNRVNRAAIAGVASTGAVALADDAIRRREVALVDGGVTQEGLQLLSPAHYLKQALEPSADVISGTISDLLPADPDVFILADVARIADRDALTEWVEEGGLLIRFAGPHMAAADEAASGDDPLLPVRLRAGGRAVGGAMSWDEEKSLAPFPEGSPFYGLAIPQDVTVRGQILAQPDPNLADRTWAALSDGTPLVTGRRIGDGRVVLFHVTANADWSSIPLAGLFVQMLERLAVSTGGAAPDEADLTGRILVADRVLDGYGVLEDAGELAGVPGETFAAARPSPDLPPGLYRDGDRSFALNALAAEDRLTATDWPASVRIEGPAAARGTDLKGALLALALALLAADAIVALALGGRLSRGAGRVAGLLLAVVLAGSAMPRPALAQESAEDRLVRAAGEVVLAHVLTGDRSVDRKAAAGLRGLSDILFARTSVEPGAPMGVNLEADDLAVFTFLYWPVTANEPTPSPEAYLKLNRYLRTGGMILFDTADAGVAGFGAATPEGRRLQALAAPLDIPPLEPLPPDHVLTRSFYLLQDFPGRHAGRQVWAEAAPPDAAQAEGMPFRNLNDGVSPVLIGGNDWAAAWAVDDLGRPLFPVGRGLAGERQREIAYRFGVNLIMYVLTGNYKSDQVHVPALLERLGQ